MSKEDIKESLGDLVTDPFFSELVTHVHAGGAEDIRGTWRELPSGGVDQDFNSMIETFLVKAEDLGQLDTIVDRFQRNAPELVEDWGFDSTLVFSVHSGTWDTLEIVESFGAYTNALHIKNILDEASLVKSPLFRIEAGFNYRLRSLVTVAGASPLKIKLLYGKGALDNSIEIASLAAGETTVDEETGAIPVGDYDQTAIAIGWDSGTGDKEAHFDYIRFNKVRVDYKVLAKEPERNGLISLTMGEGGPFVER